jgi:hypothetical protein
VLKQLFLLFYALIVLTPFERSNCEYQKAANIQISTGLATLDPLMGGF